MIDFADEIKNGAERRYQEAKQNIKQVAGPYYSEIRHIAVELYNAGYIGQAKKFIEVAYLHLRQHHVQWYTTLRHEYVKLLGGKI